MNKLFIVAQREYLKVVRKPLFWIATLFFPAFVIVMMVVSAFSAESADKLFEEATANAETILVLDESGLIQDDFLEKPFQRTDNKEDALAQVVNGEVDGFFYYPADVLTTRQVEVYRQHDNLLSNSNFNNGAEALIKNGITLSIDRPEELLALNTPFQFMVIPYQEGEKADTNIANLIVPAISIAVYFLMTVLAVNVLLSSVAEEKENRMMETIWTMMKPRTLMGGKVLGLGGVVITQLVILGTLAGGALYYGVQQIELPFPIDLSSIEIDAVQITLAVIYIALGAIFLANIMIGVGAAVPTYKEASQFSTPFVLLSILPIYFFALIFADPSGTVALITSYTPFTAPLVLLLRNALGVLPGWEMALGAGVLFIYAVISLFIAGRMFSIGALEYNNRVSLKKILKK